MKIKSIVNHFKANFVLIEKIKNLNNLLKCLKTKQKDENNNEFEFCPSIFIDS